MTTKTTLLNDTYTEHEEQIIDLLDSLRRARDYAFMCDEEDAFDAEHDIRQAILLIAAEHPSLHSSKFKPDKFSRGMDLTERRESVRDLISVLEGCLDEAEESGFYATDPAGFIELAIDTAKDSLTFLEELIAEEEADDLRYSTYSYYRAAV